MIARPPRSTLFPSRTLFRSRQAREVLAAIQAGERVSRIARRFDVSNLVVTLIRDGDTYREVPRPNRKSTRLNSSHLVISYAVFCLKKKKNTMIEYVHV